ncbi:hypothetical protein B6I21_07130, partial [candidate division KSB1 bacterium 4572_119]
MLSPSKKHINNSYLIRLALLIGIGLILFMFESLIPRPLPWVKPGLAHVATLIALFTLGNAAALIVVIGRVLIGSLLLGTLLNPTFLLSISGGLCATFIMIFLKKNFPKTFSIFGISISGAVIHNLTQLLIVELLIVQKAEIF